MTAAALPVVSQSVSVRGEDSQTGCGRGASWSCRAPAATAFTLPARRVAPPCFVFPLLPPPNLHPPLSTLPCSSLLGGVVGAGASLKSPEQNPRGLASVTALFTPCCRCVWRAPSWPDCSVEGGLWASAGQHHLFPGWPTAAQGRGCPTATCRQQDLFLCRMVIRSAASHRKGPSSQVPTSVCWQPSSWGTC